MAELVLRALLTLEVGADRLEERVTRATVDTLRAYLHHRLAPGSGHTGFMANLETLLRGRLRLIGGEEEARMKVEVLADGAIQGGIEAGLANCTFTFLHICLFILSIAGHTAKERYAGLVAKRFRILFQEVRQASDPQASHPSASAFSPCQRTHRLRLKRFRRSTARTASCA